MTAKPNDYFRIYPFIINKPDKNGNCYVNIRVSDRKDRNRNIDVSVYLSSGERFKLRSEQIVSGKVDNGLPETRRNELNHYLDGLTNRLNNFTSSNPTFTKATLESFLYGEKFLSTHKKMRTKEMIIPIKEKTLSPLFQELRQKYPKRRETVSVRSVDALGFEVFENQQVVIDPLDLNADDFPKSFPKEIYEHLVSEYEKKEYKKLEQLQPQFFHSYIKFELNRLFFNGSEVKENIKIDTETLKEFEKTYGRKEIKPHNVTVIGSDGIISKTNDVDKLLEIKEKNDHKKLSTKEVYQKGLWNKSNIFEMFGSIYFDPNTPDTYRKILVRLLEYREHRNPSENIKDLDSQWLIDFFLFLKEKGFYKINTAKLDPLSYDKNMFFQDKPREQYKPKSLNKMIGITKTLINGSDKFSFYKKGYIPKLDLSDLKLSAITDEKDVDGTRIEHNLTKEELDELFWFEFDERKSEQYQQIFNAKNKSKGVDISIEELTKAKQLFILQVMFGGLRGYKELSTAKLLKHNKDEFKVTFFQNKVTNTVTNPLNDYTERILKPLGYKIPVLTRISARGTGDLVSNIDALEQHYRSLVQTIGEIINFDRSVLVDGVKFIHQPIKEIFNPYFSRKTFGTICSNELGLSDADIGLFTGHKDKNQSELSSSYIQKNTIDNKKKLISNLKVG